MTHPSPVSKTALELRSAFDRTYALPSAPSGTENTENLLAIRLAANPYGIRISEIIGLVSDRKVIGLPGTIPELVGLAGIRGSLVSVYSLAALLGHSRELSQGRWLVLCGRDEPVGLTVTDFEGYLKVPADHIYAADDNVAVHEHVGHAVRIAEEVRMIVNISSVLETIQRRSGTSRVSKEG